MGTISETNTKAPLNVFGYPKHSRSIKFMLSVNENVTQVLASDASFRGLTIQELIRVILGEYAFQNKHRFKGAYQEK